MQITAEGIPPILKQNVDSRGNKFSVAAELSLSLSFHIWLFNYVYGASELNPSLRPQCKAVKKMGQLICIILFQNLPLFTSFKQRM